MLTGTDEQIDMWECPECGARTLLRPPAEIVDALRLASATIDGAEPCSTCGTAVIDRELTDEDLRRFYDALDLDGIAPLV